MAEHSHGCNVLDRREVSSDHDGTLPDGKGEATVSRQLNKKATCPHKSALVLSSGMVIVILHRILIPDERLLEQSHRLRIS